MKPKQENDSQFELDEYDSDEESKSKNISLGDDSGLTADTLSLLEKLKGGPVVSAEPEPEDEVRIFYCSRTHSQLTQFAHELRRVKLPASIPIEEDFGPGEAPRKPEDDLEEGMKHISLGSRKALCINHKVQALSNPTAINERCLDLQRPGTSSEQKCSFLPNKDNEALVNDFRDHTLAKIRDIEDIGKIGKKVGICPYYASRPVIKHSEVSYYYYYYFPYLAIIVL